MPRTPQVALDRLVAPRSMAVVGVSQRGGTGAQVLENLKRTGFEGSVVAVNPKYSELHGVPCYPSVSELPDPVDVVVAAVPGSGTVGVLEEARECGIEAAVVLAAGFGEGGQYEERAARVRELAADGMAVCGPNCFGILNVVSGAAAYSGHVPKELESGPVALVSQSGGLANRIIDPLVEDRGIGFSYVISCGNQLGVTLEEYVAHLVETSEVDVLAVVMERLTRPDVLSTAARRARELGKTIIAFTLGRTETGLRAVQAHTGALVSREDFRNAFLDRIGVIRAEQLEDLVEGIELHATSSSLRDRVVRRAIVLSGSGGDAAAAADAFSDSGVELPPLGEASEKALRDHPAFPPFATVGNPLDGTGSVFRDESLYEHFLTQAAAAPEADTLCVNIQARPGLVLEQFRHFSQMVADLNARTDKLVVAFQPIGLGLPDRSIVDTLHRAGVPLVMGTRAAARGLALSSRARDERASLRAALSPAPADARIAQASRHDLGFMEAYALLVEAGLPMVSSRLARTEDDAADIAISFGTSVAVKVEAAGLLHKSDIGGVVLACEDEAAVRAAFKLVVDRARDAGYAPEGAILQPMGRDHIAECFVSVVRDPVLGPMVSLGLGGVLIEVLRDVVIEPAPVDHALARDMLSRLRGRTLLQGHRDRPTADTEALADLVVAVGDLAVARSDLETIEINPVLLGAQGNGARVVDAIVSML